MKKFYFALLAMLIATTAFSASAAKVYFNNTSGWENVNIYYWYTDEDGNNKDNTWPGEACTKVAGTNNVWSAVVPDNLVGMIFNNGNGDQTPDIKDIVDGDIYTSTGTHETYTPGDNPEQPEETYPQLTLRGEQFGNWSVTECPKFTYNEATNTFTLDLKNFTFEEGKKFKLVYKKDAKSSFVWYGHNGSVRFNENYTFSASEGDASIAGTATGDFKITFNPESLVLNMATDASVEYPEEPIDPEYNAYFENTANWEHVYAYVWNMGGSAVCGSWPGKEVTEKVTIDGKEYYKLTFSTSLTDVKNIIFNNGSGTQTGDLPFENGGVYTSDGYTGQTTGIEGITVDSEAAAEYFNLQGVRVANPSEGLYIVRRGNTVTKQYIR